MNRTKDELLLECIKQFEHIENALGHNRLSTTRSLIDEINQSLTIPAVVGQSEQFNCDYCEEHKPLKYCQECWEKLEQFKQCY